jgi:4,5-dihydroxyphthalate decarboxylase
MKLSVSLVPGALTGPILAGDCPVEGVDLDVRAAKTVDGNSRQMLDLAFDIAEMSLATFVRARDQGAALIGLPIFTGRRFLEPGIGVRPDLGIAEPRRLAGHRIGLPQLWMTSSVWHRAVLRHVYRLDDRAVTWVAVQPERFDIAMPAGTTVERRSDVTLPDLLRRKEIDAVVFPRPVEGIFEPDLAVSPFADQVAAQRGFFGRTGMFPIMHFVVMREELHRRRPDLAPRLVEAFTRAKAAALADPAAIEPRDVPLHGADMAAAVAMLGADPWPYGLAANRPVLEWFLARAHEQGLTGSRLAVDTLFADVGK